MANPDDFLYEYAVVRYVPRVDREEFVNIGLIMLCKRRRWLKGAVFLDERRISNFDPRVNIENLRRQASIFQRTDIPFPDIPAEEKYRWLSAVKSAVLQVSPSHPGIVPVSGDKTGDEAIEILENEFERLLTDLVK